MDVISAIAGFAWLLNPLNILTGMLTFNLSALLGGIAGLALLLWAFQRLRFLRRFVFFVIAVPPAILLWLVGLVSLFLWKPVDMLTEFLLRYLPLDRMSSKLLVLPARFSRDPLLKGDRLAYAEAHWPRSSYPELYVSAPPDLYRPPYEDGRLIDGRGINWLADRHLTDGIYRSSVRAGFKAGVLFFCLIIFWTLFSTILNLIAFFPALLGGERQVIEQWPGEQPVLTSAWPMFFSNFGTELANLFSKIGALFIYLPAAALMAIGTAILISLLLLTVWFRQASAPYTVATKDADVRWPRRIESRNLLRQTYRNQVAHALSERLKSSCLFTIGNATGILRTRGDLAAPLIGQSLVLDEESLFQHTLVFGGTGEGKTTAILKPLLFQILGDKRYGAFIADAKGVLWSDALQIADRCCRSDDVLFGRNIRELRRHEFYGKPLPFSGRISPAIHSQPAARR